VTAKRFFIEKNSIKSGFLFLQGKEHEHLSRVVRKKPGDEVVLFDAAGNTFLAKIESIHPAQTKLAIIKKLPPKEKGMDIILGQAMLKMKKMELIIQKATELGIQSVVPIRAERTVIKLKDGGKQKLDRWKKISLSASKQSGRSNLMKIESPVSIQELVKTFNPSYKILLTEKAEKNLKEIILSPFFENPADPEIPSSTMILVGPEGGWTDKEEEYIVMHGYTRACLSDLVLRSETAAISAISAFTLFWK
jgi:16S rRNA (uracil1498-N3)-methyltransferase